MACFTFDIHRKEKRRKQNFEERERGSQVYFLGKRFLEDCEVDFDFVLEIFGNLQDFEFAAKGIYGISLVI